ncbi:hypothetical protein CRENBAI_002409, partial [Crenichthys baileyi]
MEIGGREKPPPYDRRIQSIGPRKQSSLVANPLDPAAERRSEGLIWRGRRDPAFSTAAGEDTEDLGSLAFRFWLPCKIFITDHHSAFPNAEFYNAFRCFFSALR